MIGEGKALDYFYLKSPYHRSKLSTTHFEIEYSQDEPQKRFLTKDAKLFKVNNFKSRNTVLQLLNIGGAI